MSNIFFISDIHYGHRNLLSFKNKDGTYMRPEFAPSDPNDQLEVSRCMREFHNTILENINKVISPNDTLINCGDCTMYYGNGVFEEWYKKINTINHQLIVGNHDDVNKLAQMKIFKKIQMWRYFKEFDFTATHAPLDYRSNKGKYNIIGHVHGEKLLHADGTEDLRYINVCVEKTNYFPVHLDDILQSIRIRKEKMLENPNLYPVRDVC